MPVRPLQAGDAPGIGPYRLLARLGAGGMGTVFLAASPGGRLVALKVVRAEFADDERFRERFRREIEAARRVSGLYTAPVLDGDADAPHPWLAVAYVPAPTLAEAVTAIGPLPEAPLRALGAGLAEALLAVHAAGLVHRDLKPGNILLAGDGPKVIDFGITKAVDASQLTGTDGVLGTPAYMSPEQITASRDAGPASDVFSLAAVLAYAATGIGPFSAGDPASLLYRVMYEEPRLDGVPGPLRGLLAACLDKDPGGRPGPQAVLDALLPADPAALISAALRREVAAREAEAAAVAAAPVAPPPPPPQADDGGAHAGRRRVLRLAAVAAVAVAGTGGGATAWALNRRDAKPVKPAPRVSRLATAPAPAWTLSWPGRFDDRTSLRVSVAGDTVVWHGHQAILGVHAASGRRLWTFDRPTGGSSMFDPGYRVFGTTVFALAANDDPRPNVVHVIDAATGSARRLELPGEVTELTDVYGTIGSTVFVGGTVRRTGDQMVVFAVDIGSGRVLWRFPSGADDISGVADGGRLYLMTPRELLGIDAATGVRAWRRTWYTGEADRARTYPLVLGDGLLFFGPTGLGNVQAAGTRDGKAVWTKDNDDMETPVVVLGSTLVTMGGNGFYINDQATGALRRRLASTAADLATITPSAAGSPGLLAAAFTGDSDSSGTSKDGGFFATAPDGGSAWVYRGPAYNHDGWQLAVSGTTVYATDSRRLVCFRQRA
ncbi:PQQ-binding-like beta-propeller repeat protein [Actinomadura sp. NTSP31]|uniref:serine/threonine-protein kinase n=1 Tax=Actinomadura sp. NTSP31 TaxID=1735447 RepID=UPI0035C1FD50